MLELTRACWNSLGYTDRHSAYFGLICIDAFSGYCASFLPWVLAAVYDSGCLRSHHTATHSLLHSCKASKCFAVGCNDELLVVIHTLPAWFLIWCCTTACPDALTASRCDGSASSSLPCTVVPQQLLVCHCVLSYLCACWQCFQVTSLSSVLLFYSFTFALTSCLVTSERFRHKKWSPRYLVCMCSRASAFSSRWQARPW